MRQSLVYSMKIVYINKMRMIYTQKHLKSTYCKQVRSVQNRSTRGRRDVSEGPTQLAHVSLPRYNTPLEIRFGSGSSIQYCTPPRCQQKRFVGHTTILVLGQPLFRSFLQFARLDVLAPFLEPTTVHRRSHARTAKKILFSQPAPLVLLSFSLPGFGWHIVLGRGLVAG